MANTDLANNQSLRNIDARQGYLGGVANAANQNVNRGDVNAQALYNAHLGKNQSVANALTGNAQAAQAQGDEARKELLQLAQLAAKSYGAGSAGSK